MSLRKRGVQCARKLGRGLKVGIPIVTNGGDGAAVMCLHTTEGRVVSYHRESDDIGLWHG